MQLQINVLSFFQSYKEMAKHDGENKGTYTTQCLKLWWIYLSYIVLKLEHTFYYKLSILYSLIYFYNSQQQGKAGSGTGSYQETLVIIGTKCARMDQVKFVEDSFYKILLGPFLNILTQISP